MAGPRIIWDEEPRQEAALPPQPQPGPAPSAMRPSAPSVPPSPATQPAPTAPPQVAAEPRTTERGTGIMSKIDAGVRGAADVLTFGAMDEIAAYLGSLTGVGGKRGDYEGNLAQQRAVDTYDKDAAPIARGVGQVAGGVGAAVALPSLAARYAGASLIPRVAAGAVEGAGYGAAYGFGSGEGGLDKRVDNAVAEAPTGALIGGVANAAAPLVAKGVDRLLGRNPGDALQEAKQAVAATIGVPAEQVPDEMARRWAATAGQAAAGRSVPTARAIAADEFGIPLTRGQATGDVTQQAFEEASRNAARGPAATRIMEGFDRRQGAAIDTAAEDIARAAANAAPDAQLAARNPLTLSEQTLNDLRAAERSSAQGVNQAYDKAREGGASLMTEALQGAPQAIRRTLDDSGIIINDTLTPYASRALSQLDEFANLGGVLQNRTATLPGGAGDRIAGVSLDGIEKQRSQLLAARNNAVDPTDRRAVGHLINGFDNWLDDAAHNGLLSGTPEGLQLFKDARSARRTHGRLFESNARQADDDAGKMIERMIGKDVTPGEVANALFGASRVGEKGMSTRLADRMGEILGRDSPQFGAIRQAAWEKLITNDRGERLGPQALASAVQRFTSQNGEAFARTLFSPEEIGRMRRFSGALKSVVADPRATNPSKTAYAVQRLVADSLSGGGGFAAALGLGANPALAIGAGLVAGGGRTGVNGARALRAAGGVVPPSAGAQPVERAVAGAGRGATAIEQDRNEPLTITVRPNARAQ